MIHLRSLLFAPANHARRVARLGDFGADAVVLDLEDAVGLGEKDVARAAVPGALAALGADGPVRCVRINGPDSGLADDDLDAVLCGDLDAVVLPKVDSVDQLRFVDSRLSGTSVELIPLVENALGISTVDTIARDAPERVRRLAFGSVDYTADLGLEPSPDGRELQYARSRMVNESRAAGLAPPLDGPFLDIHDNDGLLADTTASRANGFRGRVVIHPGQVATVHHAYSRASPAELARARRIVAEFVAATGRGEAAIQVDGLFVDRPVFRRAVELIDRHEGRSGD